MASLVYSTNRAKALARKAKSRAKAKFKARVAKARLKAIPPSDFMNEKLYDDHFVPFEKEIEEFNFRTQKSEKHTEVWVRFGSNNSPLCEILREISNSNVLYENVPEINAKELLPYIHDITAKTAHGNGVAHLIQFIKEYAKKDLTIISKMLESGEISFGNLWYIFKKDDKITLNVDGVMFGGKIASCRYVTSFFGESFTIQYTYISTNGTKFVMSSDTIYIGGYRGVKKLKLLPVQPLTEHDEARLVERGKIFREIANKASHLEYTGNMICKAGWSEAYFVADGRCMVDLLSFRRMNPNDGGDFEDSRDSDAFESIPDDMLFMCSGWVFGFSLKIKRWGRFAMDNLKSVVFNDSAFDTLVLKKPETKTLILALIENTKFSFQDVIQGKGGGCIMLLYGNPGVGKTLTAESTAEHQHRPLYSVSVGELGTDPETLEENLRRILEMATIWGAVVLIDEADIFLEHRDDDADIARNAMVAIFLRMLEYHQGLLYLTTNRVRSFDPAFFSRISVAIRYDDFNSEDRVKIWNNLLDAAQIDKSNINIDVLSKYDINGRQIKNAIRIGQSLARSEKMAGKREIVHVSTEHIERIIRYTEAFLQELTADQVSVSKV